MSEDSVEGGVPNNEEFGEAALPIEEPTDSQLPRTSKTPRRRSVGGLDLLVGLGIIWVGQIVIELTRIDIVGGDLSNLDPLSLVTSTVLANILTVLVVWILVCRKYRKSIKEGFFTPGTSGRAVLGCAVLGLAAAICGVFVMSEYSTGESLMAEMVSTTSGLLAISVLALVVPPLEEIYYRGFLFPVFRKIAGAVPAVLLTTLWFAGVHALQLYGDPVALLFITVMALVWTVQREVSGSVLPSLVTHWVYNLTLISAAWVFPP